VEGKTLNAGINQLWLWGCWLSKPLKLLNLAGIESAALDTEFSEVYILHNKTVKDFQVKLLFDFALNQKHCLAPNVELLLE